MKKHKESTNARITLIIVALLVFAIIIAANMGQLRLASLSGIDYPIHVCNYGFAHTNRYNSSIGEFRYTFYPLNSNNGNCDYGSAITSPIVPINANTETVMKRISYEINNNIVEYNGIRYQYSPPPIPTYTQQPYFTPTPTPIPTLPPIPNPPIPTPPVPSYTSPPPLPPHTTPSFTSLTFIIILIVTYLYRKFSDSS